MFADLAGEVGFLGGENIFAIDADVVIGVVEDDARDDVHTEITADDGLVAFFGGVDFADEVTGVGDEVAAGFHHETRWFETVFHGFLTKHIYDTFGGGFEVERFFARAIGDAESAAEIDEFEFNAEFVVNTSDDIEETTRDFRKVGGIGDAAAGHHVDAEAFDAGGLSGFVGGEDLVGVEAKLGFWAACDVEVADVAFADAWIDAEGDDAWRAELQETRKERDVVEIEDDAGCEALFKVGVGEEVAGEDDVFALEAEGLGELDLV